MRGHVQQLVRSISSSIVTIVLVAMLLTLIVWFASWTCRRIVPSSEPFAPVSVLELRVDPPNVRVGEPAVLHNGICSDWHEPLRIQVWLGAQEVVGDALLPGDVINIIGDGDTPELRARETLMPGCFGTEGFHEIVPAIFHPGTWRIVAHVIVTGPEGQEQNIVVESEPFTIAE